MLSVPGRLRSSQLVKFIETANTMSPCVGHSCHAAEMLILLAFQGGAPTEWKVR